MPLISKTNNLANITVINTSYTCRLRLWQWLWISYSFKIANDNLTIQKFYCMNYALWYQQGYYDKTKMIYDILFCHCKSEFVLFDVNLNIYNVGLD